MLPKQILSTHFYKPLKPISLPYVSPRSFRRTSRPPAPRPNRRSACDASGCTPALPPHCRRSRTAVTSPHHHPFGTQCTAASPKRDPCPGIGSSRRLPLSPRHGIPPPLRGCRSRSPCWSWSCECRACGLERPQFALVLFFRGSRKLPLPSQPRARRHRWRNQARIPMGRGAYPEICWRCAWASYRDRETDRLRFAGGHQFDRQIERQRDRRDRQTDLKLKKLASWPCLFCPSSFFGF
mmetsp:Transcript_33619/g.56480  ORF Transcript_33619/g.56480 Transcript_33619/m.56480 type:complete len:238 (+) Transcript_33619:175-888(+)